MQLSAAVPGQVVLAEGHLGVGTVADLHGMLAEQSAIGSGDLLLDCRALVCRDSTGLGALLTAHRRTARAGRRLVLVAVPDPLHRLLVLTRLSRVLHVVDAAPA